MRSSVATFAGMMEARLRENDHKGGWDRESDSRLFARLVEEVGELAASIAEHGKPSATECVDVANFAMMLCLIEP